MTSSSSGANGRVEFARRNGVVEQPLVHDGERVGSFERHFASQHLLKHHAQSVDTTTAVASLAPHLFRRDVILGAHQLRELGESQATRAFIAGDAEIDQLDIDGAVLLSPPWATKVSQRKAPGAISAMAFMVKPV